MSRMESAGTSSRAQQQPILKKKKLGRGRSMTVKVFYSLDNARSSNVNSPALSGNSLQSNASESNPIEAPQSYTCLARLTSPVWVDLLGSEQKDDGPLVPEFGKLTLKTCLSAICISRPQLVDDPAKDYAISAVDPYESSLLPNSSAQPLGPGQGLMEGKGMLSWNLAERKQGTTWVCGRVTGGGAELERKRKKQRLDISKQGAIEIIDSDEEEEIVLDTLEVFLHLVERPAFTPDQFLNSLRSFANPARAPHPSSDRASSPPPRFSRLKSSLGDPVKKKRPREADPAAVTFVLPPPPTKPNPSASTSASTPNLPADLSSLKAPQVLALLTASLSNVSTGPEGRPMFALDTEQGRALLPAIRSLAKFYGMDIPAAGNATPKATAVVARASVKGKERQIAAPDILIPNPFANLTSGTVPPLLPAATLQQPALPSKRPEPIATDSVVDSDSSRKTGTKKKKKTEAFAPMREEAAQFDEKGVQIKASKLNPTGCVNCGRKNSSNWRQNIQGHVACNVCGIYFNKNSQHRVMPDRGTSPSASIPIDPPTSIATRSIQPRLTATCEADLLRSQQTLKKRKVSPGMIAPPSPSKHIGPYRRNSPGTDFASIFKPIGPSGRNVSGGIMTSPGRSPRRISNRFNHAGIAATSPVRGSYGLENNYDFTAIYAAQQSPSPERNAAIPDYLLTASPGTALKRALSDTDFGSFTSGFGIDMNQGRDVFGSTGVGRSDGNTEGEEPDLSFLLRSSPDEKENAPPSNLPVGVNPSLPTHMNTTNEFDSILSSLRNDFVARISESGIGGPSSPIPSSPCVQPRTSSATPGQKGKGPTSSGRNPPSILDSFIDGLVPGIAMSRNDELDQDWNGLSADGAGREFDLSQLLLPNNRVLAKPFLSGSNLLQSEGSDFDFNSDLPPSSPPALPFALTPEFDGVTPEGDTFMMEEDNYRTEDEATYIAATEKAKIEGGEKEGRKVTREAVAQMIQSLGLPSIPEEAWAGLGDSVHLDTKMVAHILQLIEAKATAAGLIRPAPEVKEKEGVSVYDEMFAHS